MLPLISLLFLLDSQASVPGTTEPTQPGTATVTNTAPVMNDVIVEDALRSFKSLTRVEKKARMKEVKQTLKEFKAMKKAGGDVNTNQVLLAILAVLLPPLAVGLHEGELNGKFWLSVLLTLLFWLPGVIYALIVVLG